LLLTINRNELVAILWAAEFPEQQDKTYNATSRINDMIVGGYASVSTTNLYSQR
jgi:hypothetical protein